MPSAFRWTPRSRARASRLPTARGSSLPPPFLVGIENQGLLEQPPGVCAVAGGDQRYWVNFLDDNTATGNWGSNPSLLLLGQSTNRHNTRTWRNEQRYTVTPTADDRPRLVSNGQLSITGFQTALNLGGLISAPTVNISSTQPGAVFTNDAYGLRTEYYTQTTRDHVSCCRDVIYLVYTYGLDSNTVLSSASSTTFGAGINAGTLNASGFSLANNGNVEAPQIDATSKSGSLTTTGVSGASFGGITVTLPTNPNGFFVVSQNPNSGYLIETNPRFGVGSSLGSEYLVQRLGIDPATVQKRLGDGGYEASLVRDQLTAQVGVVVLINGETEAAQMQRLMDNGVDMANKLGLTYGVAPTDAQLANLDQDMVWMVETEVAGQKVLAPVVYLSAATKAGITTGAVIAANNINMNLTDLTNTGGTISGSDALNITTEGDIKNLSGTIKGGDVSLLSKAGSIINETFSSFSGNDENSATIIGKGAGIEATGDLNLDAKKDIVNKGASLSAGENASLKAGENIVFDTIEDKKSSTTHSSDGGTMLDNKQSSETTGSTTNIGSTLKVGGNLKTESGKDTIIRGSTVEVGGDGDIKAGGDLKILDVQDVQTSSSSNSETGLGVGGGVYGSETTTETSTKKTSKGSTLSFGGNANLEADGDMTIQGSDVSTDGDLSLKAKLINILEGRNEETHSKTTSTTTFLKVEDSESHDASGTETFAKAGAEGDKAGANTGASANAQGGGSGGLTISGNETTTTDSYTSTGKGSNIKSGGNLKIESADDTLIRGSNIEAAENVDLQGKNINIEASKDISITSTTTTSTKVGLYGGSDNQANAGAQAGANADGGGADANAKGSESGAGAGADAGNANVSTGANVGVDASSDNTLDIGRIESEKTTTEIITHQGSSIKSGGNLSVKADNQLNVKGSGLEAGGDVDLKAKDMSFTAVEDSTTTTTTSSKTNVGLYAEAGAEAKAEAGAGAGISDMSAGASASANADADASAGLRGTNTTTTSTEGSTTAKTSSIKSGGSINRSAEGKITDEGTQIEAGGDFTQDSAEWDSKAAKNTTFSSSSTETNTVKAGAYAEAGAGAAAGADAKGGAGYGADAGASAGGKASYNRNTQEESSASSQAVTSNIKSGGNVKTTTSGKTSLEGTNLEAAGDMELNAGSLDFKAARDTITTSSESSNIDAEIKAGVDATKAVTGSISGSYDAERSSESSSMAVTGSMKSGGNLKVNTKDDARFEGTDIEASGDAAIKAGGNLTFDAARDTTTSEGSWKMPVHRHRLRAVDAVARAWGLRPKAALPRRNPKAARPSPDQSNPAVILTCRQARTHRLKERRLKAAATSTSTPRAMSTSTRLKAPKALKAMACKQAFRPVRAPREPTKENRSALI